MARAHNTNMIDMGLNYNTRRERNACIHKKIKLPAYTVKVLTKSRKLNICVRAKCLTALPVFTIIVNAKGSCNTILIPNIKFIFAQKKGKKCHFVVHLFMSEVSPNFQLTNLLIISP